MVSQQFNVKGRWNSHHRKKKSRIVEEKRSVQENWINSYFAGPQGTDKVICLICKQVKSVLKEFNVEHHYETNHK